MRDAKKHGPYGICIHCDARGTKEKPLRRGLCTTHYAQFTSRLKKKIKEDGALQAFEWQESVVEAGLILPSKQGRQAVAHNPFQEFDENKAQQETLAAGPFPEDPHLNRQVFQALAKIDAEAAKQPPAPKEVVPERKKEAKKKG